MAFTSEESAELLEFLRAQLSASAYQHLDDAALSQARFAQDPASRLQMYLDSLIGLIAGESGTHVREAEARLQKCLSGPFDGFEIELPPYERDLIGRSTIPLREAHDSSALTAQLRVLLEDLDRSNEPPLPPRTRGFSG